MRNSILKAIVILAVFSTLAANAASAWTNEVWFAIRGDTNAGSGTIDDPYNGSGTMFSQKMRDLFNGGSTQRTNITINLMPGKYLSVATSTLGYGVTLPLNSRLIGAGQHNTIIQLTNASTTDQLWVIKTQTSGTDLYYQVSDITIDASWNANGNSTSGKINGLQVSSTRGGIERVRVINTGGAATSDALRETFPISWRCLDGIDPNFTIRDCLVDGRVFGGATAYGTAITMVNTNQQPWSYTNTVGMIVNNKVINFNHNAFGLYGANLAVIGNQVVNAGALFNSDSPTSYHSTSNANFVIAENKCFNMVNGIYIGNANHSYWNCEISDNFIELNNADQSAGGNGIGLNGNTIGFIIRNNFITVLNTMATNVYSNVYGMHFFTNYPNAYHTIVNNYVHSALNNDINRPTWISGYPDWVYTDSNLSVLSGNYSDKGRVLPRGIQSFYFDYFPTGNYTPTYQQLATAMERVYQVDFGTNSSGTRYITLPNPDGYGGASLTFFIDSTWTGGSIVFKVDGGGTSTTGSTGTAGTHFLDLGTALYYEAIPLRSAAPGGRRLMPFQLQSSGGVWMVRRP